jgi:hypothetical protein
MNKTKHELHCYLFKVTGGFDIDSRFEPIYAANGQDIVGFTLPDGREVNIEICLRFEGKGKEHYVVSEREMSDNGFCSLNYDYADFYRNETGDYSG